MARYIDADKAKHEFNIGFGGVSHAVIANQIIDSIPTEDVVEVKHGEWILEYGTYGKMICSECKNEAPIINKRDNSLKLQTLYVDSPYCHHCGAKMVGRRDT